MGQRAGSPAPSCITCESGTRCPRCGVDAFACNSHYVARRIRKTYRRKATVIYPPVDLDRFEVRHRKDDYYVTLSRLVPYKRVDLSWRKPSDACRSESWS